MRRDGNPTGNRTHISYPDYTYYIWKIMRELQDHLEESDRPLDAREIYDALAKRTDKVNKLMTRLTNILEQHVNLLVADWKSYGEPLIYNAKPSTDILRITYFFSDIMYTARRKERKVTPAIPLERPDEKTANPWYIVGGLPTLTSGLDGPRPCPTSSTKDKRQHVIKLLDDLERLTFHDHASFEDVLDDLKSMGALPRTYEPLDIRPLDSDELSETARRAALQRKPRERTEATVPPGKIAKARPPIRTTPGAQVLDYVAVPPLRKYKLIQTADPPSPSALSGLSSNDASPVLPSWTTIDEGDGLLRRPRSSPTPPVGEGSHWLVDIHGNIRPEGERGVPPHLRPIVDAPPPTGDEGRKVSTIRSKSSANEGDRAQDNAIMPDASAHDDACDRPNAGDPSNADLPEDNMQVDSVEDDASAPMPGTPVDALPHPDRHFPPDSQQTNANNQASATASQGTGNVQPTNAGPSTVAGTIAPPTTVAGDDDDPPMYGPLTEEHWIGRQQGRLLAPWDPIPSLDGLDDD